MAQENSKIRVLMQITAQPDRQAELRSRLLQFVEQRCREVGCVRCELLQHHVNTTRFIVVEEWFVEARLQSNLNSVDFRAIFQDGLEFLAEPVTIDWYEVIGTPSCTS